MIPFGKYDETFSNPEISDMRCTENITGRSYLPTPPLGQDMTQGQILSGV